jgi:hypothetical protein
LQRVNEIPGDATTHCHDEAPCGHMHE